MSLIDRVFGARSDGATSTSASFGHPGWSVRVDGDGRLRLLGRPRRGTIDLILGADGLTISTGTASALLGWDPPHNRTGGHGLDVVGDPVFESPFTWETQRFVHRSFSSARFGVVMSTDHPDWSEIRREIGANLTAAGGPRRVLLPAVLSVRVRPEAGETFDALCALLGCRPELRERLAEPERVVSLGHALSERCLRRAPHHGGVRLATADITSALGRVRANHRLLSRPIDGDPTEVDVVDEIWTDMQRRGTATGLHTSRSEVQATVHRLYLDLDPWPFGALFEG